MKNLLKIMQLLAFVIILSSCQKDEEIIPKIPEIDQPNLITPDNDEEVEDDLPPNDGKSGNNSGTP
ncbi:hypothetical protein QQ008_20890 [Fulvivirgaceae bacterium BMA10]|uniref:Uncharacterized protein n=1 Tax=Splendidivirga corallicola TaxID=3051826 RepID=A0ABT8KT02_9BACT|nr:hypothetical protein [Fulvivirgaceae bacterium BMA10]